MNSIINDPESGSKRSPATRLFLWFLGGVTALYLVVLVYHVAVPRRVSAVESPAFLERCRQICESYGLVPTGRLDDDAREFLEATDQQKLSGDLAHLLEDSSHTVVESMPLSLVGQPAPEFSLLNSDLKRVTLKDLNSTGPVVVVFYYGYFCSHCVAQLFALNDDVGFFEKLGVTVVAISADPPEETSKKYAKYGDFGFPVLSDPENSVAGAYGVWKAATDTEPAELQHGTFVIDRLGKVVWAYEGHVPFTDNLSLLKIASTLSGVE